MRVISECDIILDWNLLNQISLNHNSERGLYSNKFMIGQMRSSEHELCDTYGVQIFKMFKNFKFISFRTSS